jgi:hypothetical protein
MRRKKSEPPKSPLEWGQRVKIRTRTGLETTGKISFVGYMPYPGMWSFEVTTDVGSVYKTHGSQHPGAAIARLERIEEEPHVEQTLAGAQYVAPGMPPREVPTSGLKARVAQNEEPMPLERVGIEAKQGKLF